MLKPRSRALLLAVAAVLTAGATGAATTLADAGPTLVFAHKSAGLLTRPLVRHYLGSGLTLTGMVYDNGEPAANVTVTATSTTGPDTSYTPIAQTVSDVTGRFALKIPRSNSRSVQITTGPAEPVTITEHVRANIAMRVKALPGARLLFTGRVIVAPGTGLPWVILQDHTPLGWQTFAAMPVKAAGRFRYIYRAMPSSIGATFQFRAHTPPTDRWWGATTFEHPATVK